jgi:hypothetical protein
MKAQEPHEEMRDQPQHPCCTRLHGRQRSSFLSFVMKILPTKRQLNILCILEMLLRRANSIYINHFYTIKAGLFDLSYPTSNGTVLYCPVITYIPG